MLAPCVVSARFLGYTVFSPSWPTEDGAQPPSAADDVDSARVTRFAATRSPSVELVKALEQAEQSRNLVTTVPWLVEFAKMMSPSPLLR